MPPGPTRLGPSLTCISAETFLSIKIKTKPRNANNPMTQTAMIKNSISIAVVALNVLCNQLSIEFDMFSKLQPIPHSFDLHPSPVRLPKGKERTSESKNILLSFFCFTYPPLGRAGWALSMYIWYHQI